jgi:hypothetical protein
VGVTASSAGFADATGLERSEVAVEAASDD